MEKDKAQKAIIEMFNDIAPTYDKANRILSMGTDISWRKKACNNTFDKIGKDIKLIVDVACGTGDMMGFWQKQAHRKNIKLDRILGIDPSSEMLKIAKKKFPDFDFAKSAAEDLPLPNACADILSISYGIRNVLNVKAAFKEFSRVVRKDGYVVILEFTKSNKSGFLHKVKQFYLSKVLPYIGGLISKNYKAYKYLPDSIDNFLTSSMLQEELADSGFNVVCDKSSFMDISTLIIARKCR